MHELGSIYNPTKHKRKFSVMFSMSDCYASNLGSIPSQVNFLEIFILLNSSKIRRELRKNSNVTLRVLWERTLGYVKHVCLKLVYIMITVWILNFALESQILRYNLFQNCLT